MNRKTFLKSIGLSGLVLALPIKKLSSVETAGNCVIVPSETAGPFPLDLTTNEFYFRKNIIEDRVGVPLRMKMKIVGDENCEPMPKVRVNIWHCDKDGNYSGYNSEVGKTNLRGYQITDSNGEVEFETIFPGWYPGRICHIHFQVYVSSSYSAVSQFGFDLAKRDEIYANNPSIYTKGADPLSFEQDGAFVDGYEFQVASLVENTKMGGYDSFINVTVEGTGTTGVGHIERQNALQFNFEQNYPNPVNSSTKIPFTLHKSGNLELSLYDLEGKKVHTLVNQYLNKDKYNFELNLNQLNLPKSNYALQLVFTNGEGTFKDCKIISVNK